MIMKYMLIGGAQVIRSHTVNYPKCNRRENVQTFFLPNSENLTNQKNYLEALQRQGFAKLNEDNLLTRVWWDK